MNQVGDILQLSGASMPTDLVHAWFIVRAVEADGSISVSHPYADRECSELYVPRLKMTSGVYRREVARLIQEERDAGNPRVRFATEYRPVLKRANA